MSEHSPDTQRAPDWLPGPAQLREFFGDTIAYPYYRVQLSSFIGALLPKSGPCTILDIGAGDGYLGSMLGTYRPETRVVGLEVQIRKNVRPGFAVVQFDGIHVPMADHSFDVTLLSNVLHHAANPLALLQEAVRVTRRRVIIKDHLCEGALDELRLTALDVIGNWRFSAQVDARYLSLESWRRMFAELPTVKPSEFRGLSFRKGPLRLLFSNGLEVMFVLDQVRAGT